MNDKKGWGIMVLYDNNNINTTIEHLDNNNSDNMNIKLTINKEIYIINIVYWDVKDKDRNIKIIEDMEKTINLYKENNTIIIGDFNAHYPWIDGREKNNNSFLLETLIENNNLIINNNSEICDGKYTRTVNDTKTTVDYIITNDKALNTIKKIKIDENKKINISDHNMIKITLSITKEKKHSPKIEKPKIVWNLFKGNYKFLEKI